MIARPTDPLELGCLRAHGGERRVRLRRIHLCGCLLLRTRLFVWRSMIGMGDVLIEAWWVRVARRVAAAVNATQSRRS